MKGLSVIASKVTITPETRAKINNSVLSPAKKREVREELIKERIRKTPDGYLTKRELIISAGLNADAKSREYSNGITLINSMVKRGVIAYEESHKFRKSWCVISDAKVKPSPKEVAKEVVSKDVIVAIQDRVVDKARLIDLAKEFAWRENSDSLREFIASMQNTIK